MARKACLWSMSTLVIVCLAATSSFADEGTAERSFVPGTSATQSAAAATELFNGIYAGNTTWDFQQYSSARQIETGIDVNGWGERYVHITWTYLHDTQDLNDPNREVRYNWYDWTIPGWTITLSQCPMHLGLPSSERSGFGSIEINASGNAVVFQHSNLVGYPAYSSMSAFSTPGSCFFVSDYLFSSPTEEYIYLRGAIGQDSSGPEDRLYHVGGRDHLPGDTGLAHLVYWRYVRDGAGEVWEGPVLMDSSFSNSHQLFARGDRVIYALPKARDYSANGDLLNSDLGYYESTNKGADWITTPGPGATWETGGGWNVTDYSDSDLNRCWIDITGGFDSEDRLHLLFTTTDYRDTDFSLRNTTLYHWDEGSSGSNGTAYISGGTPGGFNSANFGIVAVARWETAPFGFPPDLGDWDRYISQPSLAFGDGQTTCGEESNLDYLYVVYTQFGSPDTLDQQDASAAGYLNGNIWLSISDNGGASWGRQNCITTVDGTIGGTPSRTPGCDVAAGDTCLSEHWASVASTVNDTLHVFYLGDLEAGAAVMGDGVVTVNPMMYLPIFGGGSPNPLCPVISPVLSVSITSDPDCVYYADNDEPVNTEELTIANYGNAILNYSLGLYYVDSPSGWLSTGGSMSIPVQDIPPGGPAHVYVVTMDGSQLEDGLHQAQILVSHDDPSQDDPYIIPIDFYVNDSFDCNNVCDCDVWRDIDGNGQVNPVDVVILVNFVYKNLDNRILPPYCPYEVGDVNCDGSVNPLDVVAYVIMVYHGMWPPASFCDDPCSL